MKAFSVLLFAAAVLTGVIADGNNTIFFRSYYYTQYDQIVLYSSHNML